MSRYNSFPRTIVAKCPEDPLDAKAEQITRAREAVCPRCGHEGLDRYHHAASFALPECWWDQCEDCGYQGEPA